MGGGTCLALPSIPRLGPLPGFLVTAREVTQVFPMEADLSWWPRSEPRESRAGGPESSLGQWSCPLLGSLLEPRESPDLRSLGLAETHLCPSGTPAQAQTPLPNTTQVQSPPHPRFQNSLFADIYSTLPQPGSLPRPGQCGGKSGSPPTREGWGSFSTSLGLIPASASAQHPDSARASAAAAPQPGVGG